MGGCGAQVALVLVLVLVNVVFAGSEMALVQLRESQLQRSERTVRGGRVLARLARDPNRFLATISATLPAPQVLREFGKSGQTRAAVVGPRWRRWLAVRSPASGCCPFPPLLRPKTRQHLTVTERVHSATFQVALLRSRVNGIHHGRR